MSLKSVAQAYAKKKGLTVPGESKYKNKKTTVDGVTFGSKLEARIYQDLTLQEHCGLIQIIELQPTVLLTEAEIVYRPDFLILNLKTNRYIWVEAKGMETPVCKLKFRLWKVYGPGRLEIHYKNKFRAIESKQLFTCIEKKYSFTS